MQISKNKKFQYLFFTVLSIYIIFNGGNTNLFIQLNFIILSIFLFFCLKDKNYKLHLNYIFSKNKKSIMFYLIFITYLFFQILPLPIKILNHFSPEKYNYIIQLDTNILYSSLSFAPSETFFQILNYISIFIVILIVKIIFQTERHKQRLYLFLSLIGFVTSIIAIVFYLNGNPDMFFLKNSFYQDASTGFFVNRTVFSIFLLFCLISSLEILKNIELSKLLINKDNFFLKIYVRLFLVFITIGIITSFSRIGNFLLLSTVIFYLINEFFFIKKKNYSFLIIIILILFIDILILGFYFGAFELIDRFSFLKEEFSSNAENNNFVSRLDIIKFSFFELKNFIFYGYGLGSFENIFQLKYYNPNNLYANHAHSDLLEIIGEIGLLGMFFLICSLFKFFSSKNYFNLNNNILLYYGLIILFFDFSLHIPLIQIMFIIFFLINKKFSQ
tara:strand:+ start:218 stop:1549 length:1332 start_codon:yes stop_codon:yes gene_type:complete